MDQEGSMVELLFALLFFMITMFFVTEWICWRSE